MRIALGVLLILVSVTLSAQTPPLLSSRLSPASMLRLAPLARERFISEWDAIRDEEIASWSKNNPRTADVSAADARVRIAFQHAQGRVMYPFFHWRETDASAMEPDPALAAVLARLPRIDARLWEFPEVREFFEARLHECARERLAADAGLQRGDARWLRAEFRCLEVLLPSRDQWMDQATRLLARHIDDDGAAGIDEPMGWWLARSPPLASVRKINEAIDADRSHLRGVRRLPYRQVSGVTLFLNVLEPARSRPAPRAVVLWLHGGSATEGTWWHSPVTVRTLLESEVVVVAAELTTGNRFDRDSDQITDAGEAFGYLAAHASELGLDASRLGVAGFSSGGSLALLLATRGAAPTSAGRESTASFPRPAAAIVSGACADPLSEREDGYFRKVMSKFGDPADFSPFAQLRSGLPPVLAVHAAEDEFCSFQDMARFADRSRSLGNEVAMVTVEGASHFFGFYHKAGQDQQRKAIEEALRRWGW